MGYKVFNLSKSSVLAVSAGVASNFFSRLIGLMFRKKMGPEEGLIFYRANSIHTFFMRFPIDIVFLTKEMEVKKLVECIGPWRMVFCKGAYATLELPAGKINQSKTELKDRLEFSR